MGVMVTVQGIYSLRPGRASEVEVEGRVQSIGGGGGGGGGRVQSIGGYNW